ncbi:MAG: hypothetical protein GY771_05335 [bacterium]|nr:hypothetical protein [bacterium]
MKTLISFFIAGVILVVAMRVFKFEQQLSDRILAGVRTRDAEQLVVAAALTVALGMVAVLAAQAFRKVA